MKQIRNRILFPVIVLMVANSLAGCTKSDPTSNNPYSMEIAPLAALGASGVEAGSAYNSSVQTKASASGGEGLSLNFARADQTSASTYGEYEATAITATRSAGTGNQPIVFSPLQYYRADGLNTKLTGWYPNGTYDGTARTVSWTIDGEQDVMTAPMQQGSWKNIMPAMTFDHRLVQLQFYPYAETQSAVDSWGKITKIEVLDQQNIVLYDLTNDASGAVSFSGDASYKFSAGIAAGGASLSLSTTANKTTDAKQMGNPVMIVPQSSSSYALKLRITTSNNKYKEVTLTQALPAGASYRLYMKFAELDITIEATVAPWSDVTISENVGEPRIGDYLNGGIVYEVTDAKNYKVFSLDEGSSLKWSAQSTYVLGVAGQSAIDGKGNVAAMKSYSLGNINNADATEQTTGVFATDFPAAAFCDKKNTGGVTGWYLPARDELLALYTAYRIAANKTAIDAGLDDNSGTVFPTSSFFRSSTESSLNTSRAWGVTLSVGRTGYNDKSAYSYVRCVRDI